MKIKAPIGKRLKYFREKKGLSQSQLETEADLSFGSISRTENGLTNPTKETLLKIADLLKLNNEEIIYLIHPDKLFVTKEDIEKAIRLTKDLVDNSNTPIYVLDNLRRVVYTGDAALQLFGLPKEAKDKIVGLHILEMIFNPAFPAKAMLEDKFHKLALSRVNAFQRDLAFLIDNGELDETIEYLSQFPNFKEIWEESKKVKIDPYSKDERTFTLKYRNNDVSFYFTNTPIEEDRRFELIEYFPS